MSMYIQADKINAKLKVAKTPEDFWNIAIHVGRVAKFRCRSNVAFRNFINACFEGVAKIEIREFPDGRGGSFDGLVAVPIENGEVKNYLELEE